MLPFTSLNAATSTGTGASKDLEVSLKDHTVLVRVTGGPTSNVIDLEGSHDGTTWFVLATNSIGNPADPFESEWFAADHVVRYIRTTLTTLAGGSSPSVTTTIASA